MRGSGWTTSRLGGVRGATSKCTCGPLALVGMAGAVCSWPC